MTTQPAAQDDLAAAIEAFIRESAHVAPNDAQFHRDADLFEGGYIDSLLLVSLTAFLEDDLGYRVPTELTFHPDFTSINGISELLRAQPDGPGDSHPTTDRPAPLAPRQA